MLQSCWTTSLRLPNGYFVLPGRKREGRGAFPKNFNVKILPAPRQTICFCGIIRVGRPCLAGNARGGRVPAAGGPTNDGALLLARLSLFGFHQLRLLHRLCRNSGAIAAQTVQVKPEPLQRDQFLCRDAHNYILQFERRGLLFSPSCFQEDLNLAGLPGFQEGRHYVWVELRTGGSFDDL